MNDSSRNQESETLKEKVVEVLRQIYDPEISVNIYDLGLIYDLDIDEEGRARIRMTLTAPACPFAGTLPGQVEMATRGVEAMAST